MEIRLPFAVGLAMALAYGGFTGFVSTTRDDCAGQGSTAAHTCVADGGSTPLADGLHGAGARARVANTSPATLVVDPTGPGVQAGPTASPWSASGPTALVRHTANGDDPVLEPAVAPADPTEVTPGTPEPTDGPTYDPTDDPTADPSADPPENPTEDPTGDPTDGSATDPADAGADQPGAVGSGAGDPTGGDHGSGAGSKDQPTPPVTEATPDASTGSTPGGTSGGTSGGDASVPALPEVVATALADLIPTP